MTITDNVLHGRLRELLQQGWIDIPQTRGFGGTGAPGIMLEEMLGVRGGNRDTPDAGKWEIKFRSGTALLTMFHLEGQPKGHMHEVVRNFGWEDKKGRTSFRHTIHGATDRGFYVTDENGCVMIRNDQSGDTALPYWTHDSLINAFVAKFRRLVVVKGKNKKGMVKYETAHLYWEPQTTMFIDAIVSGVVAIDFDARTTNGRGIRNHGTKFRIKYENLRHLYHEFRELD